MLFGFLKDFLAIGATNLWPTGLLEGVLLAQQGTPTPSDVAHGVGSAPKGGTVFPPFDTSTFPSQLFWLAIAFALFYIILSRFVIPRISGTLEMRQDKIAGDLAEAERLQKETEAAASSYESALAQARKKALLLAQSTAADLEAARISKQKEVEARLTTQLLEAEKGILELKARLLAETDTIARQLVAPALQKLIGETPSAEEIATAFDVVHVSASQKR